MRLYSRSYRPDSGITCVRTFPMVGASSATAVRECYLRTSRNEGPMVGPSLECPRPCWGRRFWGLLSLAIAYTPFLFPSLFPAPLHTTRHNPTMRFLCLSYAALLISLTLIVGLMPTSHASTNTARHATRYGVVAARDQVAATESKQRVKIARDEGQLQSGSVLQKVHRKKADAAFPRSEPGQKQRDEVSEHRGAMLDTEYRFPLLRC